jgi:hypothetical protein
VRVELKRCRKRCRCHAGTTTWPAMVLVLKSSSVRRAWKPRAKIPAIWLRVVLGLGIPMEGFQWLGHSRAGIGRLTSSNVDQASERVVVVVVVVAGAAEAVWEITLFYIKGSGGNKIRF